MTARHRRRPHGRPLVVDLTPDEELDVRLTGEPADVAAAIAELDATTTVLHKLTVNSALRSARGAETVEDEVDRTRLLAEARNYMRRAQEWRR